MKILNCCSSDWANFSHDNANALRSVGLNCMDVKFNKHEFGYDTESAIASKATMLSLIMEHDVVQIMHSDLLMLDLCREFKGKLIVWHTGTAYRKNSDKLNAAFNPRVSLSICALGELMGKGAKNEVYMVGAIDVKKLQPGYVNRDVCKIAHYPSNETIKGSDEIFIAASEIYHKTDGAFDFVMSVEKVPYPEQLRRMDNCDVYIELFAPLQDGYGYGSWGITALEAAAMGKIVITCHTTVDVYEKSYKNRTPFFIANTKEELREQIERVAKMGAFDLKTMQSATRSWVARNHSYIATGNKWKELTGIN